MTSLIYLAFTVQLASAASHSLRYIFTAVTPGINLPEFTVVGLVDGGQFVYYDSNIRKFIPKTDWIEKNEDKECWEAETQDHLRVQEIFKANLATGMMRFNHTEGVHTVQAMYGCFFPKAVMISWQKNGQDLEEDAELRELLPNQDGTFQKRSILTVSPEELNKHNYTCVIQHSSLEKEMVLPVTDHRVLPQDGESVGIIVHAGVAVLLLVMTGCVGVFIWKKM
ncbi:hypothetical protein MHYP_G00262480 [Metynnis hypsauchen]